MSNNLKKRKLSNDEGGEKISLMDFRKKIISVLVSFDRHKDRNRLSYRDKGRFPKLTKEENKNRPDYMKSTFNKLTEEEKMLRILHYQDSDLGSKLLTVSLNDVNYVILRRLFTSTFGKRKLPSKPIVIESLVSKFFGKEVHILSRDEENNNLRIIGDLRDFQSVDFNGKYVPFDLIRHILSFFRYNSELINTVGRISKGFYISILSTWTSVKIDKKNLFKISSLALQSVREITLVFETQKTLFINSELKYFLQRLSSTRLRQVTVVASFKTFVVFFQKIQNVINSTSKELLEGTTQNPFSKVTELCFKNRSDLPCTVKGCNRIKNCNISLVGDLRKIFPSLTSFSNPSRLDLLTNFPLRKLKMSFLIGFLESLRNFKEKVVKFARKELYPVEYFRKYLQISKLRELDLEIAVIANHDQYYFDLFSVFSQVEKVKLITYYPSIHPQKNAYLHRHQEFKIDHGFLKHLRMIKELSFIDSNYTNCFRFLPFHSLFSDFFSSNIDEMFPELQKLEILTRNHVTLEEVNVILVNCKKLSHVNVSCDSKQHEDDFHDIPSELRNFLVTLPSLSLKFVHLEFMLKRKRRSKDVLSLVRTHEDFNTFLFLVERKMKRYGKEKLTLGFFSDGNDEMYTDLFWTPEELEVESTEEEMTFQKVSEIVGGDYRSSLISYLANQGEKERNRMIKVKINKSKKLVFGKKVIMEYLGCLSEKSDEVDIITRKFARNVVFDWDEIKKVLVEKKGMTCCCDDDTENDKEYWVGGLNINRKMRSMRNFYGYENLFYRQQLNSQVFVCDSFVLSL